jgi:hypothetical protein
VLELFRSSRNKLCLVADLFPMVVCLESVAGRNQDGGGGRIVVEGIISWETKSVKDSGYSLWELWWVTRRRYV